MQRILVTGGSGFIGTNLVEYFVRKGIETCNMDLCPPRCREHGQLWREVDIRDRVQVIRNVEIFRPDVILHCAARTDLSESKNLDGYAANYEGICHLIEAIRALGTIQRVIFFSSQLVCQLGYAPKGDDDYRPTTLYGRSKVLGEKIVKAAGELGTTWCIVRPTSLWGPWFNIPYRSFFTAIQHGRYIHPQGAETLKQWGYIGNTVFQIQCLLEAPKESIHRKTFYLADYQPIELRVFADQVQAAMGVAPIRKLPVSILQMAAKIGDGLQTLGWRHPPLTSFRLRNILTDEIQDTRSLYEITGPLPYPLEVGIEATVQWMKEQVG